MEELTRALGEAQARFEAYKAKAQSVLRARGDKDDDAARAADGFKRLLDAAKAEHAREKAEWERAREDAAKALAEAVAREEKVREAARASEAARENDAAELEGLKTARESERVAAANEFLRGS